MSNIDYKDYDFGVKGIIKVNSPEGVVKITTSGLKETLMRIQAVNVLLKEGKSVKSKIKDDEVLKELIQKISGEIEVLSHEIAE
jgi:hypothetical protein